MSPPGVRTAPTRTATASRTLRRRSCRGAAGEIHKSRGREPVADRPPPLLDDHRAGEPRPLKGGVELLGDRVQQRAVGGLVEHDLAQAAELGGEYLRQLGLKRDVGLRQVPQPVEQVQ